MLLYKINTFFLILVLYGFSISAHQCEHQVSDVSGEIRFIENKGQWEEGFLYKLPINGGAIFFEKDKVGFSFLDAKGLEQIHDWKHHDGLSDAEMVKNHRIDGHAYFQAFINPNKNTKVSGQLPYSDYRNYFLTDNTDRWKSRVQSFKSLLYSDFYEGIDLTYYPNACENHGEPHLKYDFIVEAGADLSQIKWTYSGAETVNLNNDGSITVHTSVRNVSELKPFAYQLINGDTVVVPCYFTVKNDTFSFEFPAGYDKTHTLIIDPELIFSTFTGSSADNWGYTATYDADGNLYAGGVVRDDGVYPTTPGAFQVTFGGGIGTMNWDIGITKFTSDGSALVYSTYLGGSFNEIPHSIVVNSSDELIVYGTTGSTNFPVTANAFDNTFNGGVNVLVTNVILFPNGSDIFLTRFSVDGTSLISSTYVGGTGNDGLNMPENNGTLHYNYGDHARGEVIVDSADNVLVASLTLSTNFPVTPGAFQTNYAGGQMGIVFKMSADLSSMMWGSYIGGSSNDAAYSIKIGDNNDVFVCGGTSSSNFPTTPGVLNPLYPGGNTSGYVARIAGDGSSLLASSFLGTQQYNQSYFLQLDGENRVYVLGQSLGTYPITSGPYINPNSAQFIHMMTPALDSTYFSTVFGNGTGLINISPTAFLVDNCYNIYVSGWGGNLVNYPYTGNIANMPITPNAFQTSAASNNGFYFFILSPFAENLIYATYFSGNTTFSREHVDGGTSRFDQNGIIYQAICADCGTNSAFPTTPGAWSNVNNSVNCNLGAVKYQFNIANVEVQVEAAPSATGCLPFTVGFNPNAVNATHFYWDFGDGNISTDTFPVHTFVETGVYEVQLIGIDSNLCAGVYRTDTSYLTIIVEDDYVVADFDYTIINDCGTYIVEFENLSQNGANYFWSFGDASGTTEENPTHQYADAGTFTIELFANNPAVCNPDDSITKQIQFLPEMVLIPEGPDSAICIPQLLDFSAELINVSSFYWELDDGTILNDTSFQFLLDNPGIFTLTLTGEGTDVCNPNETVIITVTGLVSDTVVASLNYQILQDCGEYIVAFENLSQLYQNVLWDFGDGETSTELNPQHQYLEVGTYQISLYAYNSDFCIDTDSVNVEIQFLPEMIVSIEGPDTVACAPALIDLTSVVTNATSIEWFFPNGIVTSETHPQWYIDTPGVYEVMLVGQGNNVCNPFDTAFIEIVVLDDTVQAAFESLVLSDCEELIIEFTNTSNGHSDYEWYVNGVLVNEGDMFTFIGSEPGDYFFEITAYNGGCLLRDSTGQLFSLLPLVRAFPGEYEFCSPLTYDLSANTENAESVQWFFENNLLSESNSYTISINEAGEFVYELVAYNENTCNLTDTAYYAITAFPSPLADFSTDTSAYMIFEDIVFTNLSEGLTDWEWEMGDGFTTYQENVLYAYYDEGTYTVCLRGQNAFGCPDSLCKEINIWFEKAVGVPDAFTPNGDGMNDILFVRGFGIKDLLFRVYNRWGELIFESVDQEVGWDGTYRGVSQETEVYVFTLDVYFLDGTNAFQRGNVTLLR